MTHLVLGSCRSYIEATLPNGSRVIIFGSPPINPRSFVCVRRRISPLLVSSFLRAPRSAGMDPGHCSGHSFRIGTATVAAAAGLSDSLIQTMGRWKSGAFLSYIRTPSKVLCTASAALSG